MRIFKKEDGTYNVLKTTLFSFILTCVLLGLICLPMFLQDKAEVTKYSGNTTTTTQGSEFLTCKNCDIEFYNKELKLSYYEIVKIKDILDLKDVSIQNVKFSFDENYLKKVQKDGEYYFETGDTVGETTLKASYDKYETSIKVIITTTRIDDGNFKKRVYYIKTNEEVAIDVETLPKNADLSLLEFRSNDESIAKFVKNNVLKGITAGKTTISVSNNMFGDEVTVYVMNTPFTLKLKVDGVYKELDEYEYKSNTKTQNLYIAVKLDNSNYTQDDIKVKDTSSGSLSTTTTFDSVYSVDNISFIYKVVVDFDPTKTIDDNSSVITFTLPDGSEKFIKITR